MTSAGEMDAFVCTLDENGNFAWAVQLGGTLTDSSLIPDPRSAQQER
jgi:hypothetical protein